MQNNRSTSRSVTVHVRQLTMYALLTAMSIIFSRVFTISTGFVRFNLGALPVVLAGVLFGPWAGFAVGAVADIIGGVLAGYAINPLITLGAGVIGLVVGAIWKLNVPQNNSVRLAAAILSAHVIGSMIINSLALCIFYNYAWSVLAVRIPNYLVLSVVEFVLVRVLLSNRAFMRVAENS